MNIQKDKFVCRSDLGTIILAYFQSKSLNYTAINLLLQKLSTSTIYTRNYTTLQSSVKYLRAITMCTAFTLNVCETIALLFSLGTCIIQIQSVRVNFACTKKFYNLSAEAIINVRNARQCARCAIFLSKIKQAPFYCRLAKGFTLLRIIQNQFRILLELRIVLASIFQQRELQISCRLCNNCQKHFWLWKVWSLLLFTKFLWCYKST